MRKHKKIDFIPVDDQENVARIIYSPSYIEDGRVSPTAFRWERLPSGASENYISVLRYDGTQDLEMDSRPFKPRNEGDSRYGFAVLNTGDIRAINDDFDAEDDIKIEVSPHPSSKRSNHAGISVDIKGETVTTDTPTNGDIEFIQKNLAMLCSEIVKFEAND